MNEMDMRAPRMSQSPAAASWGGDTIPDSLLTMAWRGRWIILVATLVGLGSGIYRLRTIVPKYDSTSRIYIEKTGPRIMEGMDAGMGIGSGSNLHTQAELMRSTPILALCLESPEVRGLNSLAKADNPLGILRHGLRTSIGKLDGILSVTYRSPYPTEAATICNAVVEAFVTFHSKTRRNTAAEVLRILQGEKEKRSKELSEELRAMMAYKQNHEGLAFETTSGNMILSKLQQLSGELTRAQLTTLDAKAFYETVKIMKDDPDRLRLFVETQRPGGMARGAEGKHSPLSGRLLQLEAKRFDLHMARYKDEHPDVMILDAEMERIAAEIETLGEGYVANQLAVVDQHYIIVAQREIQLESYFNEQRKKAVELTKHLADYRILESDWQQTKVLCEILDGRMREIHITDDVGVMNISILEVARPAKSPSEPRPVWEIQKATLMGIMAGFALAFLRSSLDQTIRSTKEISALAGSPLLGTIPSMPKKEALVARARKVQLDSESPTAEAYRSVRTAIFFSKPAEKAKIVQVTSAILGEGKSTLVSNLAIAMADSGQRVLVLDADLRRAIQHRQFELDRAPGLVTVLANMTKLQDAIVKTPIQGLDVLTAGPEATNPSELLGSDEFAECLRNLSDHYDRILVDSPPVVPVTDGCVLAAVCDVTVLVVNPKRTSRKMVQTARDALLGVGGTILGVVANDVSAKKGKYGYGYGYGYGYIYSSKAKRSEQNGNGKSAPSIKLPPKATEPRAFPFKKPLPRE